MHVDGFRFDLAATLAREFHEVDRCRPSSTSSSRTRSSARSSSSPSRGTSGEGGYQVGNFPALWTEWNGKYRDTVRDFWRGEPSHPGRVRLALHRQQRPLRAQRPQAPTPHQLRHRHDGFTLRDLVSYNDKHNEANGEDNRDGESHNRSWNCGVEGPTDDPDVLALRAPAQAT
jgi:isoamylase